MGGPARGVALLGGGFAVALPATVGRQRSADVSAEPGRRLRRRWQHREPLGGLARARRRPGAARRLRPRNAAVRNQRRCQLLGPGLAYGLLRPADVPPGRTGSAAGFGVPALRQRTGAPHLLPRIGGDRHVVPRVGGRGRSGGSLRGRMPPGSSQPAAGSAPVPGAGIWRSRHAGAGIAVPGARRSRLAHGPRRLLLTPRRTSRRTSPAVRQAGREAARPPRGRRTAFASALSPASPS